jgi:hypothetical protein
LLQQQNQSTFVTVNESDFWRKVAVSSQYCIVCFNLSDSQAHQIPQQLWDLFKHPSFDTKGNRMGKVIRITARVVSYYTVDHGEIQIVDFN